MSTQQITNNYFLHPENMRNPYPLYHRLRSETPIFWSDEFQQWVALRYQDIVHIARNPEIFSSARSEELIIPEHRTKAKVWIETFSKMLFTMDLPKHAKIRSPLQKVFSPKLLEDLRPRIQAIIDDLLTKAKAKGSIDIIQDFAAYLPVEVISEMMNVPREDRHNIKKWVCEQMKAVLQSDTSLLENGEAAAQQLIDYFTKLVAKRRQNLGKDLISKIILIKEENQALQDDEIAPQCVLFYGAGYETAQYMIGNGMVALQQNPEQLDMLKKDMSLLKPAVEEMFRYDTSAQLGSRKATQDTQIRDIKIKKGQSIIIFLGSANRDPEIFSAPDKFNILRKKNPHISFMPGIHFCIGANLARMEMRMSFESIFKHMPNIRLAKEPERLEGDLLIRGHKSIPMVF